MIDPAKALKQAESAATWLSKQSKAKVTVHIARHPDDHFDSERDAEPCFKVKLWVVDAPEGHVRANPLTDIWDVVDGPRWTEMSMSESREFTLTAEKLNSLLRRLWQRDLGGRRGSTLVVHGVPLPEWEQRYGHAVRVETLHRGESPTIRLVFPPARKPPGSVEPSAPMELCASATPRR